MPEYERKETNMKNFQEFCDSLDQEFVDSLSEETSYVLNASVSFGNAILANNFAVTMRILEHYHKWLHLENDKDTL